MMKMYFIHFQKHIWPIWQYSLFSSIQVQSSTRPLWFFLFLYFTELITQEQSSVRTISSKYYL